MTHKTIILGGGLMGSAVAWQLANYGEEVLLLEQQDATYTYGSSLGEARITRNLGPEDDIWAFLHRKSIQETEKLLAFLNETAGVFHDMADIYTTSPVSYVFYENKPKLGGFETVLENQVNFCNYAFDNKECSDAFGVKMPKDAAVLIREFRQYSGTLNPKELIQKLHVALQQKGSVIRYNTKIIAVQKKENLYEIITQNKQGKKQTLLTEKIVSAAGSYTGELLQNIAPYFQELIKPQRVFLAFFKPTLASYNNLTEREKKRLFDAYPAIYFTPELSFAMVETIDADGLPIIKIGGHFCRTAIENMDEIWTKELSEEEVEWATQNTLQHLQDCNISIQQNDLVFYRGYSCVYSLTTSEIPIVSNLMNDDKSMNPTAVALAGMSGVGAKGAMAYGLIAANLLLQKEVKETPLYHSVVQQLGFDRLLEVKY